MFLAKDYFANRFAPRIDSSQHTNKRAFFVKDQAIMDLASAAKSPDKVHTKLIVPTNVKLNMYMINPVALI